MIDEAFLPFAEVLARMAALRGELVDEEAGVRTYLTGFEIESPVELDVVRDAEGRLRIGSTPPLYYVDTSIRPSFHRLSFKASLDLEGGGADGE